MDMGISVSLSNVADPSGPLLPRPLLFRRFGFVSG